MRDFTSTIYKNLLSEFAKANYEFITFAEFVESCLGKRKLVILRHDVDKKPMQSLKTAEMEKELGIKGTYYFRVMKNRLPREEIENISKLGHEIGYHYDDMHTAGGNEEYALNLFKINLAKLRELAPVKTACMHGSPLSKYDNRDLWKNFDYHELGIIGEPYFDIDFNKVLYLTDTGRRWDGERVSIRDRAREVVSSQNSVVSSKKKEAFNDQKIHSSLDIIEALKNDLLPSKIMLTVHPQRWTDKWLPWLWEFGWQNVKNGVKYFVTRGSSK